MSIFKIKRIIIALLAAVAISTCALTGYAEEDNETLTDTQLTTTVTAETESIEEQESSEADETVSSAESQAEASTQTDINSTDTETETDTDKTVTTDTESLIPDYFGDDRFDTTGNLSLIKEQKIIYNSSEMQFIAVTTKGGNVFYILIDYTAVKNAENGEEGANAQGTVYFLNKVDDYDLFSLLYADSDSIPVYNPNAVVPGEEQIEESESTDSDVEETSFLKRNATELIMLGGGGIAVAAYYFLKIKPKQKEKTADVEEDEEDDELVFADEEKEINEDEENEENEKKPIKLKTVKNDDDQSDQPIEENVEIFGSPDDEEVY